MKELAACILKKLLIVGAVVGLGIMSIAMAQDESRISKFHQLQARQKAHQKKDQEDFRALMTPWAKECSDKKGNLQLDAVGDPICIPLPPPASKPEEKKPEETKK